MPINPKNRRYVVSDLGYGFAVHDTGAGQSYAHPAGRDKEHKSTNQLNSIMVDIFPTRSEAQRVANELNERDGTGGG